MQIQLTSEALDLIRRKGGTAALDYIQGKGCGGRSEAAIDTYLQGKDTSGYHRVAHEDIELLIAPTMAKRQQPVRVATKGPRLLRRLTVAVGDDRKGASSCSL